jgi:hypothetical protein
MNHIYFPSIKEVARCLADFKAEADVAGCGNEVDVRLQVQDGRWRLHYGDAQYDDDHRGVWGIGTLGRRSNCRDLARDLIEEAREAAAELGSGGYEMHCG